jgi:hypothetical protein
MPRRTRQPARVDIPELRRAKYLDAHTIQGAGYAVTPAILRAPFPQSSAELRAAADRAFAAELEAAVAEASMKETGKC